MACACMANTDVSHEILERCVRGCNVSRGVQLVFQVGLEYLCSFWNAHHPQYDRDCLMANSLRAVPTVATQLVCFFSWGKQSTALSCIAAPSIWWVTLVRQSPDGNAKARSGLPVAPEVTPYPSPTRIFAPLGMRQCTHLLGSFLGWCCPKGAPGRRTWNLQSSQVSV